MPLRLALLGLATVSACAAMACQIAWQRLLTFSTGTDADATTIVVAAFMIGLGGGSAFGGVLADRLASDRHRLYALAIAEVAIGAYAAISAPVLYDGLYATLGPRELRSWAVLVLCGLAVVCPTFCMGATFPLITRVMSSDSSPACAPVRTFVAANVGGALGALLTVFVWLPRLDLAQVTWLAAGAHLACAGAAAAGAAGLRGQSRVVVARVAARARAPLAWMALFALTGFIGLVLELIWYRVLGVLLRSDARAFGVLLAAYLGGLAAGALLARARPARNSPRTTFLLLHSAAPAWTAIVTAAVVGVMGLLQHASGGAVPFSGGALPWYGPAALVIAGVVTTIVMTVIPAAFMGAAFAAGQRGAQLDAERVGRTTGWLQAANIAGAFAGALAGGFVLLEFLGTAGTLRLLMVMSGVLAVAATRPHLGTLRSASICGAGSLVIAALVPGASSLWPALHPTSLTWHEPGQRHVAEDRTGVSMLWRGEDQSAVFVNGAIQSVFPYGGIHTALGILPALIHDNPERIAVIGLGSGNTAYAISGRRETRHIAVVEIASPLKALLDEAAHVPRKAGLRRLLKDPRVQHHADDGRAFLLKSGERYDIIEADALNPTAAFAGHVYSVEFFQLVRERLRPGGLAATWVPTPRVRESLRAAFPYVLVLDDVAIASERPIAFSPNALRARLQAPFTRRHFEAAGVDVAGLVREYMAAAPLVFTPASPAPAADALNRDLHARDEFAATLLDP